ncbi:TIGR04086 family membrane protein [Paenibacillus lentus]|uniref:TIGR04086 family membrane protein n=1 Tax=Paenibacillus lentus TaxID=1338368 RepID=A0A3Q8SAY8_9BACL|nr:TIGR04086 family membrane protein [Paenibacillus lentus]AZK46535.1 TIGR04086 family membrane protein [Paenibacillus lentus]
MDFFRRLASIRLSHPTLSGIWYAFLWMMVGALVLSLLLQSGSLEEHKLTWPIYTVHAAALLFGGFTSGKRAGQKGWYQGSLTGLFYGILILVISLLALDNSPGLSDLTLLLPAVLIGALGGMFGVNLHRKK